MNSPGGSFVAGDIQVQAIVMNVWREAVGETGTPPINVLDLPDVLDAAYRAGFGAKYRKGDMHGAVRDSIAASLARYARQPR